MADDMSALLAQLQEQQQVVRTLKTEGSGATAEQVAAAVQRLQELRQLVQAAQERAEAEERLMINREAFENVMKRKFIFGPAFAIYGGVAGLYDYGPPGCAIKANFLARWRRHFIDHENMLEIDTTCLTPEIVLRTSGHVDRFNDFMVRDTVTLEHFRADKLLEEICAKKLEATDLTPDQRARIETVSRAADTYDQQQLSDVIRELDIRSPAGNPLSEPFAFNLMFGTSIGPAGNVRGYLRPETAQGIFVNFRKLLEYNGGRMPFAAATIGGAFRNEIAPRSGLLRVREFTLAEIEHFVNPHNKDHPRFRDVVDFEVTLYPAELQEAGERPVRVTLGRALADHIIHNETMGYFIGRTAKFLLDVGIRPDCLRFRQHRRNEMAHYASDCWDAEIKTSYKWVECVGIADRSCYDLTNHQQVSGTELVAREEFAEPRLVSMLEAQINKKVLGAALKQKAKQAQSYLESATEQTLQCIQQQLESTGSSTIDVESPTDKITITRDMVTIARVEKRVHGRNYVPNVIEPSFGVGRIIYAILEHSYWVREGDEQRAVLSLSPLIAPYKCAVLPLTSNDTLLPLVDRVSAALHANYVTFRADTSGVAIGRRYARSDELGIPFAITIDPDTLRDGTVTLRERDSCRQVRGPIADVARAVADVCDGRSTWTDVLAALPEVDQKATEAIGKQ